MEDLGEIRSISIQEYLESRGIPCKSPDGNRIMFRSPFCRDTNYSLCVYTHTNSFYDWSQGFGGSIIDLVMAMESASLSMAIHHLKQGKYDSYKKDFKKTKPNVSKNFEYTRYLTTQEREIEDVRDYALSRGWVNGFETGVFSILEDERWVRQPSVMFLHRDEDNKICGAKFRKINDSQPRFSARGRMAFYILESVSTENYGPPTLYVVEGEGNANSLWQYLTQMKQNCVVISFGGVGSLPTKLPEKYQNIKDKKLIIDFDGDEELFSKRICLYSSYDLKPIKLMLPKGSDINSLYLENKMKLISNLL